MVALLAAVPAARADDPPPLTELVDAAAQRLLVADDVAAVKWRTGAAIEDPARVARQLEALTADAAGAGLDPDYVRRIFTDQIAATEAAEHHRFDQWTRDPDAAPQTGPELADSRGRIDGFNRAMLAQIGAHWELLHSADCAAELDTATRTVGDAHHLEEFYRQALSAATRDYCPR